MFKKNNNLPLAKIGWRDSKDFAIQSLNSGSFFLHKCIKSAIIKKNNNHKIRARKNNPMLFLPLTDFISL